MDDFDDSDFQYKHLPPLYLRESTSEHREKCPPHDQLDVACPCEGQTISAHNHKVEYGIHLANFPAKILPNWLAEITKLVNFSHGKTMQLRCFYAHGGIEHSAVSADGLEHTPPRNDREALWRAQPCKIRLQIG